MIYRLLLCLVLTTGMTSISSAQKKTTATPSNKSKSVIKIPKLKTMMGSFADSNKINLQQAKLALNMPIKVTDEANLPYSIVHYKFLYKRVTIGIDEKTGKMIPGYVFASDSYSETPIPEKWSKIIKEDLQVGEELLFYDIIVTNNKLNYKAPDIRLIIVK